MRHVGAAARALAIGASLVLARATASRPDPGEVHEPQVLPKESARKELVRRCGSWASALGVRCGHCHTGGNPETLEGVDFASDEKWEKRTARAMFRMVARWRPTTCGSSRAGPRPEGSKPEPAVAVRCVTCHRGLPPAGDPRRRARARPAGGRAGRRRAHLQGAARGVPGPGQLRLQRAPGQHPGRTAPAGEAEPRRPAAARNGRGVQPRRRLAAPPARGGPPRRRRPPRALAAFERALELQPQNDFTRKKADELRAAMPAARGVSFVLPLEPNHSTVGFSIPIAGGITRVTGKFRDFAGQIVLNEEDPAGCSVEVAIQAGSIDTGIDDRDAHLREAEFFDAVSHPLITFKSSRIDRTAEGFRATGTLTLRGVAREIVLPFRKTGLEWQEGRPLLGVAGQFRLSRSQYGVGAGWRHSVVADFLGDEVEAEFFVWTRPGSPPRGCEALGDRAPPRVQRPEMLRRIGPPGPPGLGPAQQPGGRRPRARPPGRAPQQPRVAGRKGVALAQRAQGDVLRGPFAHAADRPEPRDRLLDRPQRAEEVRVGERRLGEGAGAPPAAPPACRARRDRRRRRAPARGTRASAPGPRRSEVRQRLAAERDQPAGEPPRGRHASPAGRGSRARRARSRPSRRARAGRAAARRGGARKGSRERWAPIVSMSAPTSNTRRTRARIAGRARTHGKRTVTARWFRAGSCRTSTVPSAAVVGDRAPIGVARDLLDAGDGARRR